MYIQKSTKRCGDKQITSPADPIIDRSGIDRIVLGGVIY
jgi:hypothetical protein